MPNGEAGLYVSYCAKDFLDGTQMLGPWEELAYRRICDLIYATNDRLPDDDRMLAWATKTGKKWAAIKRVLTGGDRPKLMVIEGRITNRRCQEALRIADQKMVQKREAAAASVATGKSLKNLKQNRTDVREPVREPVRETHRTNPLSTKHQEESPPTAPPEGGDAHEGDREFEEWWEEYPHQVGKGNAERAWSTARLNATVAELREGLERYKQAKPPDILWCNPGRWLREQRWLDQPNFPVRYANGRRSGQQATLDAFDEITRH
jgi:uncharacterized protein YdaU (DUF1376 family)